MRRSPTVNNSGLKPIQAHDADQLTLDDNRRRQHRTHFIIRARRLKAAVLGEIGDEQRELPFHHPFIHRVARHIAREVMDRAAPDRGADKFHQALAHHDGIEQAGKLVHGIREVLAQFGLAVQIDQPFFQRFFFFLQRPQRLLAIAQAFGTLLLVDDIARGQAVRQIQPRPQQDHLAAQPAFFVALNKTHAAQFDHRDQDGKHRSHFQGNRKARRHDEGEEQQHNNRILRRADETAATVNPKNKASPAVKKRRGFCAIMVLHADSVFL